MLKPELGVRDGLITFRGYWRINKYKETDGENTCESDV